MSEKKVLLLNASEEILKVIDWKKAVKLLLTGKVKRPYGYAETYEIVTTNGVYELPAAVMLIEYIHVKHTEFQPSRTNILRRDDWTCQYCGKRSKDKSVMTIDHIKPKSKGGDSGWTNLVCACTKCNQRKGNKSLKECNMSLSKKPKRPNIYAMKLVGVDENGKQLWSRWIGYTFESE